MGIQPHQKWVSNPMKTNPVNIRYFRLDAIVPHVVVVVVVVHDDHQNK